MKASLLVYVLAVALIVSLVGNEILYENMSSLQKNLNDYSKANNQFIQKASVISDSQNYTKQPAP